MVKLDDVTLFMTPNGNIAFTKEKSTTSICNTCNKVGNCEYVKQLEGNIIKCPFFKMDKYSDMVSSGSVK